MAQGTNTLNDWQQLPTDPNAPYWMVWVEGRGYPAKKHYNWTEAQAEANRLAQKENKPAAVLAFVGRFVPVAPPVAWESVTR